MSRQPPDASVITLPKPIMVTKIASSAEDAEHMRAIRNTCREFMTRDNSEIDPERQEKWFANLNRRDVVPLLFLVVDEANLLLPPVGYGLCRRDGERWWVSGGLLPEWRGRGFGKRIFDLMASYDMSRPAWLEVWDWNTAAIKTYTSLGFRQVDKVGNVITMTKERP